MLTKVTAAISRPNIILPTIFTFIFYIAFIITAFMHFNSRSNNKNVDIEPTRIFASVFALLTAILIFLSIYNLFKENIITNHFISLIIFYTFIIPGAILAYFCKLVADASLPITLIIALLTPLISLLTQKNNTQKDFPTSSHRENTKTPEEDANKEKINVESASTESPSETNPPTQSIENDPLPTIDNNQKNNYEDPTLKNQSIKHPDNKTTPITQINPDVYISREKTTSKASKRLNNEKISSRHKAVNTLTKIADDWLEDSHITAEEGKQKCQEIIDILCSYIRRPFDLAKDWRKIESEGDINLTEAEQEKIRNEQSLRRLIFEEISSRLSTIDNNFNIHRGKWSEFEFNFSEAPLFYKLDNLTFEESNIYKFKLFDYINFDNSVFINGLNFPVNLKIDASFKNATFCEETDFQYANFYNTANFSNAKFLKKADFEGARFGTIAIDPDNDATESSILQLLIQLNPINFKNADFYGEAIFYNARFFKDAYFNGAKFRDQADFMDSLSRANLVFNNAVFKGYTRFRDTRPSVKIDFDDTVFDESILKIDFSSIHHNYVRIDRSKVSDGLLDALTRKIIDPQYGWPWSPLPAGARWASASSWDEQKGIYTQFSHAAVL